LKLPQADDIIKISDIPLAIEDGVNTPVLLCQRYRFNRRQALYYLQAAESLKLVTYTGKKYSLTRDGHHYVRLTPAKRKEVIVRGILAHPVISRIMTELLVSRDHSLTRRETTEIASAHSGLSGTTLGRRVQSVFSWLAWLAEETGILGVSRNRISMSVRSKRMRSLHKTV
jgi:AAA domain-containing protein